MFSERGCILLGIYSGQSSKMDFRCSCGEISKISLKNFQAGRVCRKCNLKNTGRPKSDGFKSFLSQEEVFKRFEEKGCRLLGDFKGVHQPHEYLCGDCRGIHSIDPNSIKSRGLCPSLNKKIRKTKNEQDYRELFLNAGGEMLGEFKGPKVPVAYRCVCGEISTITPRSFRMGRRCLSCGKKKAYSRRRGIILREFRPIRCKEKFLDELDKGMGIVINYDPSNRGRVEFHCGCGTTSIKGLQSFKRNPLCEKCTLKKAQEGTKKATLEKMRESLPETLLSKGLTWVSGEYETLKSRIVVRCECGSDFSTSLSLIQRKKRGGLCPSCYSISITGANNWNYNPDKVIHLRDEAEYLEWRREVFRRDGYQCRRGCKRNKKGGINAHHILNYHSSPDLRYGISNGITLCLECHKGFHQKYGKIDNTLHQIEEWLLEETKQT